eukprot:tig00001049_g6662.t1
MYWRIGFASQSSIDAVLDRKEFTLKDLMEDDELIQECKSMNKRLVAFLAQANVVQELLDLITDEPEEDAGVERKFKYPFLSCEILCCEITPVYDVIFEQEALISKLFSFLDRPPALNPLLAGYFCRVLSCLLQRKGQETMNRAQNKPGMIARLVEHTGTYSVTQLLLKMIGGDDGMGALQQPAKDSVQWFLESGLIPMLVDKLGPTYDSDVHGNAAETLVGIIQRQCQPGSSTALVEQLLSEEVVEKLVTNVFSGSPSSLLGGLSVLCELLDRSKAGHSLLGQKLDSPPAVDPPPPAVSFVLARVDDIIQILRKPPPTESMLTTFGTLTPPLGSTRLRVVEFIVSLLATKYPAVYTSVVSAHVFPAVLDLFFEFKWNNFLHAQVERLIVAALESEDVALRMAVITDAKLVDRILSGAKENEDACERPRGSRLGYMGFVTRISSALVKLGQSDPAVQVILDAPEWKDYVENTLNPTLQAETRQLGGSVPANPAREESEDDELFGRAELDMEVLQNITDFKPNGSDQRFQRYFFDEGDNNDFDVGNSVLEGERLDDDDFDAFDSSSAFNKDGGHDGAGKSDEALDSWEEREIVDVSRSSSGRHAGPSGLKSDPPRVSLPRPADDAAEIEDDVCLDDDEFQPEKPAESKAATRLRKLCETHADDSSSPIPEEIAESVQSPTKKDSASTSTSEPASPIPDDSPGWTATFD